MNLTPEQLAVVADERRRLVVNACPGSGKTHTLLHRLLGLVMSDPLCNVLVITFTRAAAATLRQRINDVIDVQGDSHNVSICTIHSLCLRVLEDNAGKAFDLDIIPSPDFAVITDTRIEELKEQVRKELMTKSSKRVDAELERRLTAIGGIRVGDLLGLGARLLEAMPELCTWHHVFVDEVQDLNLDQWAVVDQLIKPEETSFVAIGDVRQSIYEWNGARPDIFRRRWEEWPKLELTANFRSHPKILDLANRHAKASDWSDPEMQPGHDWEDLPNVVDHIHYDTEKNELLAAAEAATFLAQDETTAILCRYRSQVRDVQGMLDTVGVDYWSPGQQRGIWQSVLGDFALAALRAICHHSDRDLEMMIERTWGAAGAEILPQAKAKARENETALEDAVRPMVPETFKQGWWALWEMEDRYKPESAIVKVAEAFKFPEGLMLGIREWDDSQIQADATVAGWLRAVSLLTDDDGLDISNLCVSTVHGVKGHEFANVFITGCNETLFPGRGRNLQEERRIFYVAVTRARVRIVFTSHGLGLDLRGRPELQKSSRFLEEMGVMDGPILMPAR